MADERYGTSFPENYGDFFSERPPVYSKVGVPTILDRLSEAQSTNTPFMAPKPPRQTSYFQTPTPMMAQPMEETAPEETEDTINTKYDDILGRYKPETKARDEMLALLANTPQRNKPSQVTRITAALAGIKPGVDPDRYMFAPYYREMGERKERLGILKELADAERSENVNQRMILGQEVAQKRASDIQAFREKQQKHREDIDYEKLKMRQFEIQHPDWKKEVVEGGFIQYRNPTNMNEVFKTGVKDTQMGAIDRAIIAASLAATNRAGEQTNRMTMAEFEAQQRKELAQFQSDLNIREQQAKAEREQQMRYMTPAEQQQFLYNKASEVLNKDKTGQYRKYITVGDPNSKDFRIEVPQVPFWASAEERKKVLTTFDKIVDEIYNAVDVPPTVAEERARAANIPVKPSTVKPSARATPTPPPGGTNVMQKEQENPRTGARRIVYSTDGGKTWNEKKPAGVK